MALITIQIGNIEKVLIGKKHGQTCMLGFITVVKVHGNI